jgi:hypothetical protein
MLSLDFSVGGVPFREVAEQQLTAKDHLAFVQWLWSKGFPEETFRGIATRKAVGFRGYKAPLDTMLGQEECWGEFQAYGNGLIIFVGNSAPFSIFNGIVVEPGYTGDFDIVPFERVRVDYNLEFCLSTTMYRGCLKKGEAVLYQQRGIGHGEDYGSILLTETRYRKLCEWLRHHLRTDTTT